jgi:hypothetical protein
MLVKEYPEVGHMYSITNMVAVMSLACGSVLIGCTSTKTEIVLLQAVPIIQPITLPEDSRKSLLVNVDPPDSSIRIMNIAPKYVPGILLVQGDYHLRVSRKGYHTYDTWVQLQNNETLSVSLNKVEQLGSLSKTEAQELQPGPQFDVEILSNQPSEISGLQRIAMERNCELFAARIKANSINGLVVKQAYPAENFPQANEPKIKLNSELPNLSPQKNESWSQIPLVVKAWDAKNDKETNSVAFNREDFIANCIMLEEQESLLSINLNKPIQPNPSLVNTKDILVEKTIGANNLDLPHRSLTLGNRDAQISPQSNTQLSTNFMAVLDDDKVGNVTDNYALSRVNKVRSESAVEQKSDPEMLKGISAGSIMYNGEERIFATLEDAMSFIHQAPITNPLGSAQPTLLKSPF